MQRFVRVVTAAAAAGCLASSVMAAPPPSVDGVWTPLDEVPQEAAAAEPWIRPQRFTPVGLNIEALHEVLRAAPLEFAPGAGEPLIFNLPMPDGSMAVFEVLESPIMEPELAAKFPEIKTYIGQGVDDPHATLRMDWTYQGFHAQVLTPNGSWYIDPYTKGDRELYTAYYRRDYTKAPGRWECGTNTPVNHVEDGGGYTGRNASPLKTYRLACAATAEYTAAHGGTVPLGQSGIVTAINRVTGVYETELAIRMTLVANNNLLVYTTNPDPYTNNNGFTMLGQNQTNVDTVILTANYDIGHVFSTGGGGVAGLGVVCLGGNKARGVTGSPSPMGDPFTIDYVAHEVGHQFNANHSFAGCSGDSGPGSAAYEPGSGSTIMAYAGICGADNIQNNSDAYFHHQSLSEITAFRNGGGGAGCGASAATGNTAPTVNGGPNFNIPRSTPFKLTANGADANGDPLTYCWEQRDSNGGSAYSLASADDGVSPIIRSRLPTTDGTRTFPPLANILAGTTPPGEELPTVARTMDFRVVARDNRAAAGGYGVDNVALTVVSTAGPFQVTSPNTAVSWSGNQTVTWNVASTNVAPVSTANVRILLSTDGGLTYPTTLLATTPNDGSELVTLPTLSTTTARIRIEAVNNIYFDVSNTNFTITGPPPPNTPTSPLATPSTICNGASTNLTATVGAGEVVDWYTGSCGGTFVGTGSPLAVTPTTTTNYRARARNTTSGQVSASCALVAVAVSQPPAFSLSPTDEVVNDGDPASFTTIVSGTGPFTYQWRKGVTNLVNGGNILGANGPSLAINPATTSDAGDYSLLVTSVVCGSITSDEVTLTVNSTCGSADFDGDGDTGTDNDIEAFFACLGGNCCGTCGSADFDGDGDTGTDNDIEAFFRVLGGGVC